MSYREEQANALVDQKDQILLRVHRSFLRLAVDAESANNVRAKEYLTHGCGRRVRLFARCVENIFTHFPPSRAENLSLETLDEIAINLHAGLINLWGALDNLAWAFIWNHGLEEPFLEKPHSAGLFQKTTKRLLPEPFLKLLRQDDFAVWRQYLIAYRDSLAHRIAPYVPPAQLSAVEKARFYELGTESIRLLSNGDLTEAANATEAQKRIGRPDFSFHLSVVSPVERPVALHPQLLSDASSLEILISCFLDNWMTPPPQ